MQDNRTCPERLVYPRGEEGDNRGHYLRCPKLSLLMPHGACGWASLNITAYFPSLATLPQLLAGTFHCSRFRLVRAETPKVRLVNINADDFQDHLPGLHHLWGS